MLRTAKLGPVMTTMYVYVVMPDGSNARLWCKPGAHIAGASTRATTKPRLKGM